MFILNSFLGLNLASSFLPLYWVKPARVPKLIGAWQILFWGAGMPFSQSPIRPSRWAEIVYEGTSTEVFALSALRRAAWSTKPSALWSGPGDDGVPASQSLAPVRKNATYQFFNPRAIRNTHVPWTT
jgi:hypothetical protein